MSFRCRYCNADLVRQSAPPSAGNAGPSASRPAAPAAPPPPARTPSSPPARSPYAVASPAPGPRDPNEPPPLPINPYAAPVSHGGPLQSYTSPADDMPLAGRWERFAAQFLDGLLMMGAVLPGIVLFVAGSDSKGEPGAVSVIGMLLAAIGFIALVVYQIRMLASDGQTWGKRVMKCRIVMYDTGEIPGLGRSLGLRILVNNLIGNVPCIGAIYALADPLFIFGEERRCLHDLIAGTKVVQAE
jgi:uncharacterized RDD family membrane protein YckC